ncbi:MAG: LPP20 family lipoprotein [Candidatus Latescibacterota bacterium]
MRGRTAAASLIPALFLWVAPGGAVTPAPRPAWTQARPQEAAHYVGIGMAAVRGDAEAARQAARQNALADIVTQISVSVAGQSELQSQEVRAAVSQRYTSSITASVSLELEGVEIVDSWEGAGEVWVFARLGREEYAQARRQQFAAARDEVVALVAQADSLAAGDPAGALRLLLTALRPGARAAVQGGLAGLGAEAAAPANQVSGRVRAALSAMHVLPAGEGTCGADGFAHLGVVAATGLAPRAAPVSGLPLVLWMEGQARESGVHAQTDGVGRCQVSSLRADRSRARQLAYAALDLEALVPALDGAQQELLRELTPPPAEIAVVVVKQAAYVRSAESNLDRPLDVPLVKPVLIRALAERGYEFVERPEDALVVIEIRGNTRPGNQVGGICFAYLDLDVTVVRRADNTQLRSVSMPNVKGAGADYGQAGARAYAKAAQELPTRLGDF